MVLPKKKDRTRRLNVAHATEVRKGYRELSILQEEQLREASKKEGEITDAIEKSSNQNADIRTKIENSEALVQVLKLDIASSQNIAKLKEKQMANLENRLSGLRNSNLKYKEISDNYREQINRDLCDIVKINGEEMKNKRKISSLQSQVDHFSKDSPSNGTHLKDYSSIRTRDAKIARCRSWLKFMESKIGSGSIDSFITDFCHTVASDPAFSFRLKLTDMESFYATVKFKLSDGMLKDLKSFQKKTLGFDIFASRNIIHALRREHSGVDDYEIDVKKVERKIAGRMVEVESAVIKAKNVASIISRRLERLSLNGRLRFSDGTNNVIIGIGADKGGSLTKIVAILGNVDTPSNPHGLSLLGMYDGDDNYDSLKENMADLFAQFNSLKEITYKDGGKEVTRPIVKLPIGDCKLLSAVLGHPGQSCATPCFLCDLPWTSRGRAAGRLESFDLTARGESYDQNRFKPPLLKVSEEFIGVPGVHTILGIVQAYGLDWIVSLCNKMDTGDDTLPEGLKDQRKSLKSLKEQEDHYTNRYTTLKTFQSTAEAMAKILENVRLSGTSISHQETCGAEFCFIGCTQGQPFHDHGVFYCTTCDKYIHRICSYQFTAQDCPLDDCCFQCHRKPRKTNLDDYEEELKDVMQQLHGKIINDEDVLTDITAEKSKLELVLNSFDGPKRRQLEEELRKFRCDLRTWYQQLTGNQARTILRPKNIKKLLSIFPPSSSENLKAMESVLLSLGKLMSSADNRYKTDEEIEELESVLEDFMVNLKKAQPNATITPKLHLMCAHLIIFLRKNRSWGHVTEQGLEHLHAVINALNTRLAAVFNPHQRAELIVKSLSNFNYLYDVGSSWFQTQ